MKIFRRLIVGMVLFIPFMLMLNCYSPGAEGGEPGIGGCLTQTGIGACISASRADLSEVPTKSASAATAEIVLSKIFEGESDLIDVHVKIEGSASFSVRKECPATNAPDYVMTADVGLTDANGLPKAEGLFSDRNSSDAYIFQFKKGMDRVKLSIKTCPDSESDDGENISITITNAVGYSPSHNSLVANADKISGRDKAEMKLHEFFLESELLMPIRSRADLEKVRFDLNGNGKNEGGNDSTDEAGQPIQAGCASASGGCLGYVLMNDIDMGNTPFTPIGARSVRVSTQNSSGNTIFTEGNPGRQAIFNGLFNGNGRTIRNLRIEIPDRAEASYGLFSGLSANAQIVDLNIEGVSIQADSVGPHPRHPAFNGGGFSNVNTTARVGVVAGTVPRHTTEIRGPTISNVHVRDTDSEPDIHTNYQLIGGGKIVGGLVGNFQIGSIVGSSASLTIRNIHNTTNLSIGGLVGVMDMEEVTGILGITQKVAASIISSYSNVRIETGNNGVRNSVGGLVGRAIGCHKGMNVGRCSGVLRIQRSYAAGDIVDSSTDSGGVLNIGGLIGWSEASGLMELSNNYFAGNISSSTPVTTAGSRNVTLGGLVGLMPITGESGITITSCAFYGRISGHSNAKTGGIFGAISPFGQNSILVAASYKNNYHINTEGLTPVGDTFSWASSQQNLNISPITDQQMKGCMAGGMPIAGSTATCTNVFSSWSSTIWNFGTASELPRLR